MPRLLGSGIIPHVRHVGAYLLNDTYTTDRAAGAVDGTAAEPGPGLRTVTDSNNKLSLSGGAASFATGGAAVGNPGIWYGEQVRVPGLLIRAAVTPADLNGNVIVGFDTNLTGAVTDSFRFGTPSGAMAASPNSGASILIATYNAGVTHEVALVLRATGAMWFIKVAGTWRLFWVSVAGNTTRIWPALSTINTASIYTCDYIRVPATLWLPTPLASDGFSSWGTSDGLGHAEGIAGGLGAGGSALTWTSVVGTWGATSGEAAASALSGGVAVATVDTGKADVIVSAKLTRSGGTAGVVCRWADANNHVQARHTGTNAQLAKVVGGVATTLVDAAATYVAGAEIRVICEGQKFRLYYNNALIGSEQTIADAALGSATLQGIRSTDTGNTFDDFTAYARGSGDEHNALDNF